MSNEFFLDTAYAIALSVESDEHHQRAEELAEQLLASQSPAYCSLTSGSNLMLLARSDWT